MKAKNSYSSLQRYLSKTLVQEFAYKTNTHSNSLFTLDNLTIFSLSTSSHKVLKNKYLKLNHRGVIKNNYHFLCFAAFTIYKEQQLYLLYEVSTVSKTKVVKKIRSKHKQYTHKDCTFCLLRPLLSVTRLDTLYICAGLKLPMYPDKSNIETYFLRNRVRKQLLPAIRVLLNPKFDQILCNFSESISL